MRLIARAYERIFRRKAPRGLRNNTLFGTIWKMIRKAICIAAIPFCPINIFRIWGYRMIGFKIGKRVFIGMQCYLDDFDPSSTIIEDDVTISYRVTFAAHGPRMKQRKIVLREGCYIGTNATIFGGVEIGAYATVGSCTLVNKDVPPLSTVVGIPAKVIRRNRTPWEADDHRLAELMERFGTPEEPESPPQ